MNWGLAVGVGLPIGVAMWLVTDNVVFLSVGVMFGIAMGSAVSDSDEQPEADEDQDSP